MGSRPDYYALLHVSHDAPIEIIRSSYRTLMKTLGAHPDLGGSESDARALNEAWGILSDPGERARYDAERALHDARERVEAGPTASAAPKPEPTAPPPPEPEPASDDDSSDRRSTTRLKREDRIRWVSADGREHAGTVEDLSPRGLSFVTRLGLDRGEEIDVRSDAFFGRAVVRNVRELHDGTHLIGVEFERIQFHHNRGTFLSRSA